jgi:GNAT superfamily N-acetyltransferase
VTVRIVNLGPESLVEASALLTRALPHDRIEVVAAEKLFGSNGLRSARVLGAYLDEELVGVMATAGRWIKLIAVAEAHRRKGIGSAFLDEMKGVKRVMDHPGNYLSPGCDIRYGEARAFFERRGFRATGEVENIRSPLGKIIDREIEIPGYTIHRAEPEDQAFLKWVAETFHPVWSFEVQRALSGPLRSVHVASQQNSPVAFAAADGNNQGLGWFGPAGTHPDHRGKKLGEALLLRCLRDVRNLPEGGVIAWIGPKEFYAKACGAVDDRRFVTLERS